MIGDSISRLPPGYVRTVFLADIPAGLMDLRSWLVREAPPLRVAIHDCAASPVPLHSPSTLIDEMVAVLAETAAVCWPEWYGFQTFDPSPHDNLDERVADLLASLAVDERWREVSRSWLDAAVRCIREGRPPLPDGFPPTVHVAQLATALGRDTLVFIYALAESPDRLREGPAPAVLSEIRGGDLLVTVRVLEWLARHSAARVLLVAPAALRDAPELEPVCFAAWSPDDVLHAPGSGVSPVQGRVTNSDPRLSDVGVTDVSGGDSGGGAFGRGNSAPRAAVIADEPNLRLWPIVGRPSPFSPGEQLLAERLSRDALLGPLFGFNRWVESRFGRRFLVDLLWAAGRLVIEIDGYAYHSSRAAFSSDRQRDYELAATGYAVLRVPHDEVLADVERVVHKIRVMVTTRKSVPPSMEFEP